MLSPAKLRLIVTLTDMILQKETKKETTIAEIMVYFGIRVLATQIDFGPRNFLWYFNTVNNNIIEGPEEKNRENFQPPCVKVVNTASIKQNDALLTLPQYLAALSKEAQGLKNDKIITVNTEITRTN